METELQAGKRNAGISGCDGLLSGWPFLVAGESSVWLIGGIFLFAVVPFTLIVILLTNKKLETGKLDSTSPETENHLRHWGILDAVRSLLGFLAFVIFLIALRYQP